MNKYVKWFLIALAIFAVLSIVGCAKSALEEKTQVNTVKGGYGVAESRALIAPSAMPPIDYVDMEHYDGFDDSAMYRKYYPEYEEHYGSGEDVDVELQIIRTADMRLEVEDYFLASQKVEAFAKKYNGYVSNSNARADHNNKHSGTVTMRVPDIHFDAVVAELSLLGVIKSKNVHGQDVTEEYIDLQARIENSERHEERLASMFDNATNVNEMMNIERELNRVREQIERNEGRLRYLSNKVAMSTITVHLYEPTPVVKEWGVWNSIKKSFNYSLATLRWMIEFIGVIFPLAVVGVLIWLLVRWRLRKSRKTSGRKR
jgi:hypothetical protein